MKKSDLVSVVVLSYNSSNFIKKCLDSIANQNYDNFEIIIVDNNSTDDTKKILADLQLECKSKIILNSTNLGFNLGFSWENSSGTILFLLITGLFLER